MFFTNKCEIRKYLTAQIKPLKTKSEFGSASLTADLLSTKQAFKQQGGGGVGVSPSL